MDLPSAIQEALACMLCFDTERHAIVAGLIPTNLYDPFFKQIAEAAVSYSQQYGQPPGDHTLDLFDTLRSRNPDSAEIYTRIYSSMVETKDSINADYILERAGTFGQYQRLRGGIAQALEVMQTCENADHVAQAVSHLSKAIAPQSFSLDLGGCMNDATRTLSFLDTEIDSFPTGIKEIDLSGLGPARKRLLTFLALTGRGKSWFITHLAKTLMLHRLRPLIITCELSESEFMKRLCQSLFSIRKRDVPVVYREFVKRDDGGSMAMFSETAVKDRPCLEDENIHTILVDKLERLRGASLIRVKEYPPGDLTVPGVEALLDMLESVHKYIPDVILLDYPEHMKLDSRDYRHSLGTTFKDLRGLAVRRNLAMVCPAQANREAEGVQLITSKHFGECFQIPQLSDVVLTYSQSAAEKELGFARLYVDKGRTDADKFTVQISQAYAIGQFCVASTRMSSRDYFGMLGQGEDEE